MTDITDPFGAESEHAVPEPAEHTIQRFQANADIALKPCPNCGELPNPIVWHASGLMTFEVRHRPGCPQLIADEALAEGTAPAAAAPSEKPATRRDSSTENESGR